MNSPVLTAGLGGTFDLNKIKMILEMLQLLCSGECIYSYNNLFISYMKIYFARWPVANKTGCFEIEVNCPNFEWL